MSFGIAEPTTSLIPSAVLFWPMEQVLGSMVGLCILGVLIAGLAQRQLRRYRKIKLRVGHVKICAKQLLTILNELEHTGVSRRIRELLALRLTEHIETILDINPNEPGVKVVLAAVQRLVFEPLAEPQRLPADSDGKVKRRQRAILATIAQISKLPRRGMITYTEAKSLAYELKAEYLDIAIAAHLHHADMAKEQGDRNMASTHYRIAQNKLAQSRYHGEKRRERMQAIGDQLREMFTPPVDS